MINKKPLKLLIVDDDKLMRAIYEKLFPEECKVTIVNSGKAALEFLARDIFDAVITDINMPEMNGIELAKKVRSLGAVNGRIIIIGVTATPHFISGEASCAGISKLFAKPMELSEIQAYLNNILKEHSY